MTSDPKPTISKSLENAIRRAVALGELQTLTSVLSALPESKKALCREIVLEERRHLAQMKRERIIEDE